MLGRVAVRAGLGVTCDSTEDGLSTMVSGVPKVFETFVMMCVSQSRQELCNYSLIMIASQGDKHFLYSRDSESRDFLAKHGLTSVVVTELRQHIPSAELLASSLENVCWRMYKMRKRFMDGSGDKLFQATSDIKSRTSWGPHDDLEREEDHDDGDNGSLYH